MVISPGELLILLVWALAIDPGTFRPLHGKTMTRTLLLMRHAKSDWDQPDLSDHDRPLNARGRNAAPKMASWLIKNEYWPELICSSTAVRTKETVDRMLNACAQSNSSYPPQVLFDPQLYLASPQTIWKVIGNLWSLHPDCRSLLILGHNPGIGELVSKLANQEKEMPTAAIAVFQCMDRDDEETEFPDLSRACKAGKHRLLAFQTPKQLP
jgi:phosphohistidine phosphatase